MKNNKDLVYSKLKFSQDNYAWIFALITGLGVITLNILKILEHLKQNMYFDYYGLDINLYQYNNKNFLYNLGFSILFVLAFYSVLYCFHQMKINIDRKKYLDYNNVVNVILIFISNIYIIIVLEMNKNFMVVSVFFVFLVVLEIFFSRNIFKIFKKEALAKKGDKREEIFNYLKLFPFLIIIIIFLILLLEGLMIRNEKSYRIIGKDRVIVYSNNDYYLVLDCEIENNTLIIYKGKQEKIDSTNIYSVYREFENIKIK